MNAYANVIVWLHHVREALRMCTPAVKKHSSECGRVARIEVVPVLPRNACCVGSKSCNSKGHGHKLAQLSRSHGVSWQLRPCSRVKSLT